MPSLGARPSRPTVLELMQNRCLPRANSAPPRVRSPEKAEPPIPAEPHSAVQQAPVAPKPKPKHKRFNLTDKGRIFIIDQRPVGDSQQQADAINEMKKDEGWNVSKDVVRKLLNRTPAQVEALRAKVRQGEGDRSRTRHVKRDRAQMEELHERALAMVEERKPINKPWFVKELESILSEAEKSLPRADALAKRFTNFKKTFKWESKQILRRHTIEPADVRDRCQRYVRDMYHVRSTLGKNARTVKVFFGDETFVLRENLGGWLILPEGYDRNDAPAVTNEKFGYTVLLFACVTVDLVSKTIHDESLEFLPPLVITKGDAFPEGVRRGESTNICEARSNDGWMNPFIYNHYMEKFVNPGHDDVVVHDCFYAHKHCKEGKGHKVTLPGGTTKYVQIHDKVINRPFKIRMAALFAEYSRSLDTYVPPQRALVVQWVAEAYRRVLGTHGKTVVEAAKKYILGPFLSADCNIAPPATKVQQRAEASRALRRAENPAPPPATTTVHATRAREKLVSDDDGDDCDSPSQRRQAAEAAALESEGEDGNVAEYIDLTLADDDVKCIATMAATEATEEQSSEDRSSGRFAQSGHRPAEPQQHNAARAASCVVAASLGFACVDSRRAQQKKSHPVV
uniref:DDE-1 domain-containing protein n=1 Tax=Neobodo designis TaxID=312471 RepID=A0A7S1QFX9_NEODS|mmetsp:Transcript_41884/g.129456  ORF Transcript_41884/g.129456 Transcript_41884/m.129456 type:complete len:625 (+) Transcript_41884:35-1909(+)